MAKTPAAEKAATETVSTLPVEQTAGLPATAPGFSFEEDAGSGSESITSKDRLIPFVKILQKLSPEVNKREPANYVEGAEEGHFLNTGTKKLFNGDSGIFVIPCLFQRRITEWVPRSAGGGIVKDWGTDDSILAKTIKGEKGQDILPDSKHEIVQSLTYYALLIDPEAGTYEMVVLSYSGTQAKKARQWNTIITSIQKQRADKSTYNPPMFYMCYKLTTVPDSNEKGSWMAYKIESFKPIDELPNGLSMYAAAKEFGTLIKSGAAKADMANEGQSETGGSGQAAGTTNGTNKDDIPF